MKTFIILTLLLTGCNFVGSSEDDRLKRIDTMTANEMRNTLRICALNNASWTDCYQALMLYKDSPVDSN